MLRTTLHNTYIYEHYCAFLDENIPTVKISVFELELGFGDCEGVYDLLPSGEGLGCVSEFVLHQVLAAIVELQRHV